MVDKIKDLIKEYQATRKHSADLCKDLLTEDYVIQGMEDVSPPKWHLAHTTWFFDTFILNRYLNAKKDNSVYRDIFNSYYLGIGKPFPRSQRGLLARPSVEQIYEYRREVDDKLINLINNCSSKILNALQPLIILGINHEQQHQELLLMDIKYNFSLDPSLPAYQKSLEAKKKTKAEKTKFIDIDAELISVGYAGSDFCYDNELPRHKIVIQPFSIANKLVTNQEYLAFIEDGAYTQPDLWLADAWDWIQINHITAPLYWEMQDKQWMHFTLAGQKPLNLAEPVSHISFYEADAFARWRSCRLATEEEWEYAAEQGVLNFGDLWEWTASAYLPYPGYKPLRGIIGEYNGKFMNNQRVMRGGSFATPAKHIRLSYRNFFGPDKRWQFSGIRLVKND